MLNKRNEETVQTRNRLTPTDKMQAFLHGNYSMQKTADITVMMTARHAVKARLKNSSKDTTYF